MNGLKDIKNRILMLAMALPVVFQTVVVPARADVPKAAEGGYESILLPVSQIWTGDNGNLTAEFQLSPVGEYNESGYITNTEAAVNNGDVSFSINGFDNGRFSMTGNMGTGITFSWTKPGLYIFDLSPDNENGNGYSYDQTSYRIRLYVRQDTRDSFITVQNIENKEQDGKISEITFRHSYKDQNAQDHHPKKNSSEDTFDNSSNNSGTGNTETDRIDFKEKGNGDNNGADSNSNTNNWNIATGDESNIVFYGISAGIALFTLVLWLIAKKRNENN